MKTLAALVTVLTLVTLGGAAFACDGFYKRSGDTAQNRRADHSAQREDQLTRFAGILWACVPRVLCVWS